MHQYRFSPVCLCNPESGYCYTTRELHNEMLVELLLVITIIGILTTLLLPAVEAGSENDFTFDLKPQ